MDAAGGDPTTVLFNGLGHFEDEVAEEAAEQVETDSRDLAFVAAADEAGAEAVMLRYRSIEPDTDSATAGEAFVPAAHVLAASPDGIRVHRG